MSKDCKCGVLACIILHLTSPWTKVGVGSFRKFFPEQKILLVDNNPPTQSSAEAEKITAERDWVKSLKNVEIISGGIESEDILGKWSHGSGMQLAAEWCRAHEYDYMLHIEPDVLVSGRKWYEALLEGANQGFWFIGSHQKSYGPIHPTPSLICVRELASSFWAQPREQDSKHARFEELFNLSKLLKDCRKLYPKEQIAWFEKNWDAAQKVWFEAATSDKALLVPEMVDFRHFWLGSKVAPNPQKFPEIAQYL